MSGICDTCKRNQDCRRPIGGMDSCRLYVSGKESNYERLFGTPERAAQTFEDFCNKCDKGECNDCLLDRLTNFCIGYDALLDWLEGDSDGE